MLDIALSFALCRILSMLVVFLYLFQHYPLVLQQVNHFFNTGIRIVIIYGTIQIPMVHTFNKSFFSQLRYLFRQFRLMVKKTTY